jgi:hypothetical protein
MCAWMQRQRGEALGIVEPKKCSFGGKLGGTARENGCVGGAAIP